MVVEAAHATSVPECRFEWNLQLHFMRLSSTSASVCLCDPVRCPCDDGTDGRTDIPKSI